MTTAYSPLLKLALPVQGELSGTWGDTVNDSITSMIEEAVAGRATINTWTTNSHVLTTVNGLTSEARAAMLNFADGAGLAAAGTVICPTSTKIYIAKNSTSYVITLKTSAGTGVAIPVGSTMLLYCDGTNVVEGLDRVTGAFTVGGTVTTAGVSVTADSITANAQDGMTLEFTGGDGVISADRTGGNYAGMRLKTTDGVAPRTRINMDYNGDVSFYEPTGTTAKFFWDASAESLGIGTSSPSTKGHFYSATSMDQLTVDGTGAIETGINFASGGTTYGQIYFNNVSPYDMSVLQQYSTGSLIFGTNDTERMRLDASGNVGIGTSSPSADIPLTAYYSPTSQMHLGGAGNIVSNNTYFNGTAWVNRNSAVGGAVLQINTDGSFAFRRAGTGASPTLNYSAFIDASGNLGLGMVPSAWPANAHIIDFESDDTGGQASVGDFGGLATIAQNFYYDTDYKRKETGYASRLYQYQSSFVWQNAGYAAGGSTIAWDTRMVLDASGNLGLGVVPSAWGTTTVGLDVGSAGSFWGTKSGNTLVAMSDNSYFNGSAYTARNTGVGSKYYQNGGAHYWETAASASAGGVQSNTTLMTLAASGNLTVGASGVGGTKVFSIIGGEANSSAQINLNSLGYSTYIYQYQNNLIFGKPAAEYGRFDSSGNFLVNSSTTSTTTKFQSTGVSASFAATFVNPAGSAGYGVAISSGTGEAVYFYHGGIIASPVGSISTSASATSYNTSSDERLKENIIDANDAGDKIDAIKVRQYDWKADGSHQDYGMVAQELRVVAPEAVSTPEDPEEMMGVDYSKLVPMMLKEIQSLRARINALEAE